jgi:hypothetical protein
MGCEHIEFSQRLLLADRFIKSKAGVWISYDEIIAYWEKATGIREPVGYVTGVVAAVQRSSNNIVIRGTRVRYENEAMRAERIKSEEADKLLKENERKGRDLSAYAKADAKVRNLQAELLEATQARDVQRAKLVETWGADALLKVS